jgi:O-antigen ligase
MHREGAMVRLAARPGVSTSAAWLLALIGFYAAVPVVDVPFFGLSLSAPLVAALTLEWGLAPGGQMLRSRWLVLPALFWAASGASLAVALWTGSLSEVGSSELVLLVRSGYWCLVLIVVASVAARIKNADKIAVSLAAGVCAAALLRLIEAFALGRLGLAQPRWLTPNDYGMSFSTFAPFLLWLAFCQTGRRRWAAMLSLPVLLAALALNGSRSSWAGVFLGSAVLLMLLFVSRRARVARLAWPVAAGSLAVLALALVPSFGNQLANRWSTLSRLKQDKPFQTRLALIDKGLSLFESQPVFGIGLGRFTIENAAVDSSRTPWATPEEINSRSPHNAYIKVLAETGLAGALALATLLATLFISGVPAAIALARSGETWGLAAIASITGMCLHLWTLAGLTNTSTWFIFGLVASITERSRRLR